MTHIVNFDLNLNPQALAVQSNLLEGEWDFSPFEPSSVEISTELYLNGSERGFVILVRLLGLSTAKLISYGGEKGSDRIFVQTEVIDFWENPPIFNQFSLGSYNRAFFNDVQEAVDDIEDEIWTFLNLQKSNLETIQEGRAVSDRFGN